MPRPVTLVVVTSPSSLEVEPESSTVSRSKPASPATVTGPSMIVVVAPAAEAGATLLMIMLSSPAPALIDTGTPNAVLRIPNALPPLPDDNDTPSTVPYVAVNALRATLTLVTMYVP